MTAKKSGKGSARKGTTRRAPKAESPMRAHNHSVGPNPDGLNQAAQEAHRIPDGTTAGERVPAAAPMNTPPSSSPSESAVDSGKE